MKIRLSRRIIAMALAFVMVMGLMPATAFARTAGKDGSAEINEDYAARESLMPVGPSFSTYTLLEWTVESDPDAVYSRASIPLADRQGGFVVNPLANPEAKLMLCSLANSDHDHTSAQGTESFLSYSFNYWQYVDSFVYWSGSQEGLICCPTGEFIDAAHTNGVPVVATLGFPWGSGSGYVEEVVAFCQKDANGNFPVADKLIEVMDYYGFDGYFFNQESYGCSAATAKLMDEMIHYMHAKRPDMLISWYDSMTEGGGVSYGNAVNDSNKFWMKDDAEGNRGVDEFFMNYNWYESQITGTISAMRSIGRSEFDAFAGIDVQQNCMDTPFRDHLLVDEDGLARLSLALYCPNSTLGLSADGAAFHEVERTFYTNAVEDPRDTSIDITSSSESRWAGMSRLFADKTPITSAPFVTDFNSGHGTGYYVDGVLSRDSEWSYQSNQDVMPTWTWIIDSEGAKLSGDYDFTDAYNGGSSIQFHGDLTAAKANDIMIYSTAIAVESGMTLALTAKNGLENASLVAYLGDGSTASYDDCEQVVTALNGGEGWVETVVDLSAYAGKTLYAIGLKVESAEDVSGYRINLGRITVLDKSRAALNGPASITLDEILYTDAYTAEARVQWAKVTGASSYEIYKVHGEEKTLIMATPSTAFYIPALKRAADEADVTIEIVPVNRNGVRGKGTQLTIDWAYGNEDSEEIVKQVFENVCLNATVTGVSFENSGEPASKALDGTAANNSKWCATNYGSGWMSIDIGREVTVKRWRVEHAEYGGEANNMNTIDFALEYLNAEGAWVQVKRITNNTQAVTDVLLDEPITASQWKLQVYDDGTSPWGGIRIYEWQMFETDQFPQTDVVPMHFASAVNGTGAADSFTLKNVPNGVTVKVYDAAANLLGEGTPVNNVVTLTDLDFGTADAGRVYYTTTATAAAESAKMSAPFEAEAAEKSAAAEDVEFVKYSHPGSVTSSNGDDIYTTLTVSGLNAGDVVYVYENGADAEATKVSLPVAEGETSVSINRVLVPRAGGTLALQVKRTGYLISDVYTVETPAFGDPTASLRVYAKNVRGESLTGVRFALIDSEGNEAAQLSTTSDSGAACAAALGTYTLQCLEVPEGYDRTKETPEVTLAIEGWEYTVEVTIPDYVDAVVTGLTLNSHEAVTMVGDKVTFTAAVTGEGYFSEEVVWTVEGAASADTVVENGVLTIAADETASYLRVTAASAVDETIRDSAMVYITELGNVATTGIPFAYYASKGDLYSAPSGANPAYIFDGDYTTKWTDTVSDGYYVFYGVLLPENVDIYGIRLHNAGSAGEDASGNTVSFEIWKDIDGDYWDNNTWYSSYYTYSGYYVSQGYGEKYAAVSGNTDDVTTLMFDAPLNTNGLYIKVTDPAAEGEALNIYELELLSMDAAAISGIKRQVLEDLIAEAEALTGDGYSVGSWAVLQLALTQAQNVADDADASDAALVEAADALRSAIEGLEAAASAGGLLSANAAIVAYNGNMLNDAAAGPEKLFDGGKTNPDTDKWCEGGKNLWVAFDIGTAADVSSISIYHAGAANEWEPSPDTINTEAYELYVLNTDVVDVDALLAMSFDERTALLADNANWTQLAAVTGNHDDITTHDVSLTDARIFKFNVSDTDSINTWGDCVRVYEIEVMGAGSASAEVNKSYLQTVVDTVSGLMAKDYTADSWAVFAAALAEAEAVLADPDATQTQVDGALTALIEAYNDLRSADVTLQKILHLDNGRKLYSKDWIIALLNEMSAAGYTHLQLAFGNDGLRFVLDDMSIEANGTTYASDDVKAGIEEGNKAYHDEGAKNALTEAEMDEIIAHAQSVGIQIVPHLNMPGHMDALLDAMEYVGISDAHFYGSAQSVRSLNLNSEAAVNFTLAVLEKYAAYFAEKGCYYFHVGADEFGNDAYNGSMGFPSMGATLYTKFADFVNASAAIVKEHGMTPRAWNDGISYTKYSDSFDTDIEITYWSSGWWGYDVASAASLYSDGHGMINTHGDYYYILGVNDIFTEGTSAEHTPGIYEPAAAYDINTFMGGSVIEDPVGGMFCIWADYPGAESETEVAANIRLILRAMALRMDGESLDGMDTSVVEGGFNENGTIQGKDPVVDKSELEYWIAYAEAEDPANYTDESWAPVAAALETARTVLADDNADQDTVDAAAEALVDALLALEYVPVYTITVAQMVGGTVTADAAEAREGATVTLTVTPDEGYSLVAGSLMVNGEPIEGNSFVMPAEDVVITAEFADTLQQAIAAAEEAKAAAEEAQAAAEEAQRKAEEAAAAAEEAAESAAGDREAAEAAKQEAEEAQAAAEAARKAAEDAQAAAEAAAAAAEAHDVAAAEAAAEAAKHAQQVAELYQEIAAMKAEMAEYLADTQKAAEEAEEHRKAAEAAELACAKYYALIRLAQYADADDYDAVGQAELEAIVEAAIEAINAAESVEEVEEELAKALAAIDRIGYALPFVDVPADSFYYDAVKWALLEEITTGTSETTFSPDKTVTRAEAVTFLWRAAGKPAATGENPFTDVSENDFYYEAVLWAVENGITTGMTETTFGPLATANRAQIVTFLHRAMGKPAAEVENPFVDVASGDWYYEAVLWAVDNGITTGISADLFGAEGLCNRAQMVTFLYRAYA